MVTGSLMNPIAAGLSLLACLLIGLVGMAPASEATVHPYPVPAGYRTDARLTMTVNGQPIPVLQWTTGSKRQVEYLYARYAVSGAAEVKIASSKPIEAAEVLPAAFDLHPQVQGSTMAFTLPGPRSCIVTVQGLMLMILADPLKTDAPHPGTPGVISLPATADPTGRKDGTAELQQTIDAASLVPGGGVAYIPQGTFTVGPFRLKSGVTLYLSEGAVLRFNAAYAGTEKDFAKVVHHDRETAHPGLYVIKADDAQDIRIAGRGIIDVNGGAFYEVEGRLLSTMRIQNVRNFTLDGILVRENSSWSILTAGCEGVRIQNVKVLNGMGFEQNDAFDIISCHDVQIRQCFGYGRDDIYCLKAGGPGTHGGGITTSSANKFGNISVQDCVAYTRDGSGFKMGNQSTVSGEDFTCTDLYTIAGRNGAFLALFDGPATFAKIRLDRIHVDRATTIPFKIVIKKGGKVQDLVVTNVFREMKPVPITIAKDMQPEP